MDNKKSKHQPDSQKIRKPSLREVEEKLNNIIATTESEDDRRNKLLFLLNYIGLPKHSADVHCRTLSYTEAYERVKEWIRNAHAERHAKIMTWSACASAITALIAIIVACYIHHITYQLLEPLERPIITIIGTECSSEDTKDKGTKINLSIIFRNIGKHPAENLRLREYFALLDKPEKLKKGYDFQAANVWDQGYSRNWTAPLYVPFEIQKSQIFIYVKLTYADHLQPTEEYSRDFFCIYQIEKNHISEANLDTKKRFQPYIDKLIKEQWIFGLR